jgi:general stress protein CsbA
MGADLSGRKDWRWSFLQAAVLCAALTAASTELLSLFQAIAFPWILAVWSVASLAAGGLLLAGQRSRARESSPRAGHAKGGSRTPPLPRFERICIAAMIAMALLVAVAALAAPPNNWDSQSYHMARVMHWIQNGSVAYYPTHILRQLHSNPGAEFCVLHLQILTGSDLFAALVQWFAMVGSLLGVSLLAQQLGAARRGQIFSALVCATLPMGILQASSTQTDYVVAFWLVCLANGLLALLRQPRSALPLMLFTGAALGLAVLAKATDIFTLFPCFWALERLASAGGRERPAKGGACAGPGALALEASCSLYS